LQWSNSMASSSSYWSQRKEKGTEAPNTTYFELRFASSYISLPYEFLQFRRSMLTPTSCFLCVRCKLMSMHPHTRSCVLCFLFFLKKKNGQKPVPYRTCVWTYSVGARTYTLVKRYYYMQSFVCGLPRLQTLLLPCVLHRLAPTKDTNSSSFFRKKKRWESILSLY
jgi:hypothetical protein